MAKVKKMPARPQRLRVPVSKVRATGVDRQAKVIRGYVVALAGPFKSEGRGEFDQLSLEEIVRLWPAAGLRSRFTHPTESSDGLGKFLGRSFEPVLGTALVERDGKQVELPAVRADLRLAASAFKTPNGNLGDYVMDLAEEDSGALSSSLVLKKKAEFRRNPDGTALTGPNGEELPPLWRPQALFASDIVDEGDAVDGLLSVGQSGKWTRDVLARGEELLNQVFAGQPRNVVRARCTAFLRRYLDRRFGDTLMPCNCHKTEQLGANLGGLLTSLIDDQASEERSPVAIMGEMAAAAGIEIGEVDAIVNGTSDCPPAATLEAFASVLAAPLSELVAAAEADGCDYSGAAEEEPAEEAPAGEEPPAEPAPMKSGRSIDVLRKKLTLKEKAGRT